MDHIGLDGHKKESQAAKQSRRGGGGPTPHGRVHRAYGRTCHESVDGCPGRPHEIQALLQILVKSAKILSHRGGIPVYNMF